MNVCVLKCWGHERVCACNQLSSRVFTFENAGFAGFKKIFKSESREYFQWLQ